jgi:hypothetical protein
VICYNLLPSINQMAHLSALLVQNYGQNFGQNYGQWVPLPSVGRVSSTD